MAAVGESETSLAVEDLVVLELTASGVSTEPFVETIPLDLGLDFFNWALVCAPCMLTFDVAWLSKGDRRLS